VRQRPVNLVNPVHHYLISFINRKGAISVPQKLLFLLILTGLIISVFPLEAAEKTGWFLVWTDEFDYSGLPDPAKWSFETNGNAWRWGNGEDQYHTENRLENARVKDGNLFITALKEDYAPGFHYTSARIRSKDKGDFRYGRFEMRAKLPSGKSIWPAFWMMPTESYYGAWPASGEIDIMEYFGFIPNTAHFTIHTKMYNHRRNTQKSGRINDKTLHSDYHIYAVEWFPDRLDFYFDQQKVFTFAKESDNPDVWPYNRKFYVILNNAVGGDWYRSVTGGIDNSIFPEEYIIDYVRVYQWNDGLPHSLSVKAGNGGKVTISPSKDEYAPGEKVSITAVPDPGYKFDSWSGDLEGEVATQSLYLLNDMAAEACFVPEAEILKNGGFERNLAHWSLWADTSEAIVANPTVENGALKLNVIQAAKSDWQAQLSQELALEKGRTYRITFEAWASRKRTIRLGFNQNHPPFESYGSRSFRLTKARKQYEFTVVMARESDPLSRLELDFGDTGGMVWLDNVSVKVE
jgi:beta-glucanase (GH16 family)